MRLVGTVTTPEQLSYELRNRMLALMGAHFDNVSRVAFEKDLAEKRWVVLLRDKESGALQGFSTMAILEAAVEGQPVKAVFSGDTIVDRAYWGETELASVWGSFVLSLVAAEPAARFYWFLISKGVRTYRFLPVYFQAFYPRFEAPTPPFEAAVLRALAEQKFPGRFDAERGVIRFGGAKDRLRPELAEVAPGRLADPHTRFFLEKNPGYVVGDELACVAALDLGNLKPVARRRVAALRVPGAALESPAS